MNLLFDTIIAGAGMGGASIAAALCNSGKILVVDAGTDSAGVYTGASFIGSGISSPLMSRRARPIWRVESAVSALKHLSSVTDAQSLFSNNGILKLPQSQEQALEFEDAAKKWPQHGQWLTPDDAKDRWPAFRSPFGVLHVLSGTSVSMQEWSDRLVDYAVSCGAHRMTDSRLLSWKESNDKIMVRIRIGPHISDAVETFETSKLILALGADYLRFSELAALNLHPIKGQWAFVERPDIEDGLLPASGAGYVIDEKHMRDRERLADDNWLNGAPFLALGSTFEHSYRHLRSSRNSLVEMVSDAARMIPAVRNSRVLASGAAIRVTVPGIRLPMVGPLHKNSNVWVFTGLGSKGILMAPMLALDLQKYFTDPASIPKEIRVTYRL